MYPPGPEDTDIAAIDINDAGTALGTVTKTSADGTVTYAPFVWEGGLDITSLPIAEGNTSCEVDAINNSGWIAGACGIGEEQHAVLWVEGEIVEVDSLLGDGWKSAVATDINDNGQIIGQGFLNGVVGAFVLIPA